jgi:hypothetical protein
MELRKIDSDDVSDVLLQVEKSFGFKFGKRELEHVTTFGELCDLITDKVQGDETSDCTTQQAFYKLREAIAAICLADRNGIKPETRLLTLFPRKGRRKKIETLGHTLGFDPDLLSIKDWMGLLIFSAIIGSLITFFFVWQIAIAGLSFSIAFAWIANKFFATELDDISLGQLAKKIAREHYRMARRTPSSINSVEIVQKVKELFSNYLELNEAVLTRDAAF